MCYYPHPVLVKRYKHSRAAALLLNRKYKFNTELVMAPCGKCDECLKQKQNEYFVRFYRQALESNLVQFLTLTYRPESIPIAERACVVDMDTGQMEYQGLRVVSSRDDLYNSADFRSASKTLCGLKKSHDGVVCFQPKFEFSGFQGLAQYSYSLCREDLRLWLKNCRVKYKRQYGKSLPEFKYSAIGEYGSKKARPHVHICFFGLNRKQVVFFADEWRKKYGFTYLESCTARNKDGSDGYAILSRYVSKYVTKGQYECARVGAGDVEKPRRCQSIGFGTSFTESDLAYFAAYDLRFGKYDIQTFWSQKLGRFLLESERYEVAQEVARRCKMAIGGDKYKYKLPLILMHKLFDVIRYVPKTRTFKGEPDFWLDVGSFDESSDPPESLSSVCNPSTNLVGEIKGEMVPSALYDLVSKVKTDMYTNRVAAEFQLFVQARQDRLFSSDFNVNEEYTAFLRASASQKAKAAFRKNSQFYRTCKDKQ